MEYREDDYQRTMVLLDWLMEHQIPLSMDVITGLQTMLEDAQRNLEAPRPLIEAPIPQWFDRDLEGSSTCGMCQATLVTTRRVRTAAGLRDGESYYFYECGLLVLKNKYGGSKVQSQCGVIGTRRASSWASSWSNLRATSAVQSWSNLSRIGCW